MVYKLEPEEIERFKLLVGTEVLIQESCIVEGDDGFGNSHLLCYSGELVDMLTGDPKSRRLDYVILHEKIDSSDRFAYVLHVFNSVDGPRVWAITDSIYFGDNESLVVSSAPCGAEALPELDRKRTRTYLEPEFLDKNGLYSLLGTRPEMAEAIG